MSSLRMNGVQKGQRDIPVAALIPRGPSETGRAGICFKEEYSSRLWVFQ